jgi:Domain of unknown function (DUF4136)
MKVVKMDPMRGDVAKAFGFLLLAALCLESSARAQTVTYNYAQDTNLAEFKTYEWVSIEDAVTADWVLDSEIRAAIDAQLAMKGLTKSHEDAELLIAYQLSGRRENQIAMYQNLAEYGPGWLHGVGYSYGFAFDDPSSLSTETGSRIQFGHLVLDAYDSSHHDLVWRGRVTKAISFDQDPLKRKKQLSKAVAKLIKAFPGRPKE